MVNRFKKIDNGIKVIIWTAEESATGKESHLMRYNEDIEAVVDEIKNDPQLMQKLLSVQPENIREIIEEILALDLQLTTRKYGVGH